MTLSLKIAKSRFNSCRPILVWLILFCLGLVAGPTSTPRCLARDIVDATQTKVFVPDYPVRIVTLAPSLGELVADFLGADLSRLVGVSEYSDYPPSLKKKASIGPFHQVNLETIVALKPDVVFATLDGNPKDEIDRLRELGVSVVVTDTDSFSKISDSMVLVGTAVGDPAAGIQMSTQFKEGLSALVAKSKARSPNQAEKVILQLGDDPLVVAGGISFLGQAMQELGILNCYAVSPKKYPSPSIEDVVAKNPDIIIVMDMNDAGTKTSATLKKWKSLKSLKAVKSGRVVSLQSDELLRPTLRLLDGLRKLEQKIYAKK